MSLGLEAPETPAPNDVTKHESPHLIKWLVLALLGYSFLPAFGVGTYRSASGDKFFDLWYMIGFMLIAFFLMHEFITPLPPRTED